MNKKIFFAFATAFVLVATPASLVLAVARFAPGETLNPPCAPTDPDCTVINVRAPNSWIVATIAERDAVANLQKGDIVTVTDINTTFVLTQYGVWQKFSKEVSSNVYIVPDIAARGMIPNVKQGDIAMVSETNKTFIFDQNETWQEFSKTILNNVYVVPDIAGLHALTDVQSGDTAIVLGTSKSYVRNQNGTWQELLSPPATVSLKKTYVVADLDARDALTNIEAGNIAIVTSLDATYIYTQDNTWQQLLTPTSVSVLSVNDKTGNIILNADDVSESATNKYFTNSRSRTALSATSPLSYDPQTGVFSLTPAQISLDDVSGILSVAKGGTGSSTNTATTFTSLAPNQTGNAGKFLMTDGATPSWGVVPSGSGSLAWGSISGLLGSQSDLTAALSAKEQTITVGTVAQYYRGDKTFQTLDKAAIGLSNVANIDTTDATHITSGTLGDARLSSTITARGNTFNGASELVQLTPTGKLPALNGEALTGVTMSEFDPLFSDSLAARISDSDVLSWNAAFSWGNHTGLYRPINYVPVWSEIVNKPTTISGYGITDAFGGNYNNLSNKPTLFSGSYADLTSKPTLFSGSYTDLTNKPVLFSGSYTDLTNKPTFDSLSPTQTGNTGKFLITNGTSTSWSGAPLSVSSGGTGQSSYTNGQLLIGNTTGNTLTKVTLTAGNGITVTNGAGSITIANTIPVTQATATADATTTSTAYVVATGMTITPGAGDYLVFFTSSIANSNNGKTVSVSLFDNGTQISASEVRFDNTASNASSPVATSAYITGVLAGEAIDVRWKVSANTGTMHQRTLVVQRVK